LLVETLVDACYSNKCSMQYTRNVPYQQSNSQPFVNYILINQHDGKSKTVSILQRKMTNFDSQCKLNLSTFFIAKKTLGK